MSFELDPTQSRSSTRPSAPTSTTIQHGFVKQAIRQSLQEVVGNEEIAAIIGPRNPRSRRGSASSCEQRLSPYGILVKQFTINELRAPPSVIEAINQKNVMQQQALTAQNELQKNTFQAQGDSIKAAGRAKAILAEAEAQSQRQPPPRRRASRRRWCSTR